MGEFEDKLRDAFDGELARTPAPPGLRQRVILNAVATPRRGTRRFGAPAAANRVFAFGGALAAVAAIAVVAGSVGVALGRNGGPVAKASPSATAGATASAPQVAFGPLPAPNLTPPTGIGAGGGSGPPIAPYFGPASMTWAGQLPQVPATAPVYRFPTPGPAEADAFAARLGAKLDPRGTGPQNRNYAGPGAFTMGVSLEAALPTFAMVRDAKAADREGPTEAVARAAATDFLTRNGLTPAWPLAIVTSTAPPPQQVNRFGPPPGFSGFTLTYQRLVPLANGQFAPVVDFSGDPIGLEVTVDPSGQVYRVSGILPLNEATASYPVRPVAPTIKEALAAPPLVQIPGIPAPSVPLTRVQLVYTAVRVGTLTYFEPGYLFTGPFTTNGVPEEKRILLPALAASATK